MEKVCRVSLIGLPNSGKSTLMNQLLPTKLSSTSKLKHTTKTNLIGTKTIGEYQYLYIDTPGIDIDVQKNIPKLFNRSMGAIKESNVCILLMDVSKKNLYKDMLLLEKLSSITKNLIVILSKVDRVQKLNLLKHIEKISTSFDVKEILPLCLLDSDWVETIEEILYPYFINEEHLYNEENSSSLSKDEKLKELIKGAIFGVYTKEVPHNIELKEISLRNKKLSFIIDSKSESRKRIIIGWKGKNLALVRERILLEAKSFGFTLSTVHLRVI